RAGLQPGPFGHRGNDLLQRGPGIAPEEHVLASAQRDRDGRRLARGEVQRWQSHRTVERVTPAAALPRRERDTGLAERAQVTLDGPDADLEVLGQLPGRAPSSARRPQLLDQGVHAVGAVHGRSVEAGTDSAETPQVARIGPMAWLVRDGRLLFEAVR